jgi:LPS-assembly protein
MISRQYAEFSVDIRPPALEKTYENQEDGSPRFKHLIEPYITYRRIDGIGSQFNQIILFDERDAVANTNEFEYALVNRFFVRRSSADVVRRRTRLRNSGSTEIRPVKPQSSDKENARTDADSAQEKSRQGGEPQEEASTQQKKQTLERGEKAELKPRNEQRSGKQKAADDAQADADSTEGADMEEPEQAHELLTVKIAQKYFFDRDFGGALVEGSRNQFYPINTLSGFTFGGVKRAFSPVNLAVRYRPLSSVFADLRMDVGTTGEGVRALTLGGGIATDKFTFATNYYLSRRIELQPDQFEAGTFPGNQILTTVQLGDDLRGLYGGTRIGYDFTDRFVDVVSGVSKGRLRNSRSYVGYSWDCCGVQFNYSTFKAGLRNESAFSFTFTLAGLGSFGSDQFSQLGGGRGGRRRGRRSQNDDFP